MVKANGSMLFTLSIIDQNFKPNVRLRKMYVQSEWEAAFSLLIINQLYNFFKTSVKRCFLVYLANYIKSPQTADF